MNKGGDCIDEKQLAEVVNKKLSQRMDMTREYSDAELKKLIGLCVEKILEKIPQTDINPQRLATEVFNSRRRMGIIQPFMENPNVNEIMINGTDGIFIEINGMTEDAGVRYNSKEELFHNIQTMLSQDKRSIKSCGSKRPHCNNQKIYKATIYNRRFYTKWHSDSRNGRIR